MIREAINSISLNEGKIKFWDILKDEKNVRDSGRILSKAPKLDVSFYGKEARLNYAINSKGTIYKWNGVRFATRFNTVKEFEILYFDEDGYSRSEYTTVNMLFKKMNMKVLPYQILDTAITSIANTIKDERGNIIVQFKNGSKYVILDRYDNNKSLREKMLLIDRKIFQLEQYGFKTNSIKKALKILEPEIYNKRKISKFTNLESLNDYLEMEISFGFQDTGGITGEGMAFHKDVKKDYISLYTEAGYRYYGKWTKFDIKLKVPITKKEVDSRIKEYKEYRKEMSGRLSGYTRGLSDHIKSAGGHSGNPVWMD